MTVSQFLERLLVKWVVTFSRGGGWQFLPKNKLKYKIYDDKKVYKRKYFSVVTKNFNCKILTKTLVTFKRWDGFKDEKF